MIASPSDAAPSSSSPLKPAASFFIQVPSASQITDWLSCFLTQISQLSGSLPTRAIDHLLSGNLTASASISRKPSENYTDHQLHPEMTMITQGNAPE
jgi:hypothetical protein